jgi:hypothetical protein
MASSTKRCYFLELPPEIRVMIYNFSFGYSSNACKLARSGLKLTERDAKHLTSQSKLLRTSKQILREAAPIYQKVVQTEVELLKNALVERTFKMVTKFDRPVDRGSPYGGFFQHGIYLDSIEAFAKAIKRLENSLRACKRAEKENSAIIGAEGNERWL